MGKRFANAGEELLQALHRVEELLARYPLRGHQGPGGHPAGHARPARLAPTRSPQLEAAVAAPPRLRRARSPTSARCTRARSTSTSWPPSCRPAPGPSSLATTIRLMAGPRAGHRGVPAGPGRLLGHAAQDEQPLVRADQRPRSSSSAATCRWWASWPATSGTRATCPARSCAGSPCPTPSSPPTACSRPSSSCSTTSAPTRRSSRASSSATCPFLTTTKVLMGAVRAGVGREVAHEAIKEHAVAVALAMREQGAPAQRPARPAGRPTTGCRLDRAALDALVGEPLSLRRAPPRPRWTRSSPRSPRSWRAPPRRGGLPPRADPVAGYVAACPADASTRRARPDPAAGADRMPPQAVPAGRLLLTRRRRRPSVLARARSVRRVWPDAAGDPRRDRRPRGRAQLALLADLRRPRSARPAGRAGARVRPRQRPVPAAGRGALYAMVRHLRPRRHGRGRLRLVHHGDGAGRSPTDALATRRSRASSPTRGRSSGDMRRDPARCASEKVEHTPTDGVRRRSGRATCSSSTRRTS